MSRARQRSEVVFGVLCIALRPLPCFGSIVFVHIALQQTHNSRFKLAKHPAKYGYKEVQVHEVVTTLAG